MIKNEYFGVIVSIVVIVILLAITFTEFLGKPTDSVDQKTPSSIEEPVSNPSTVFEHCEERADGIFCN